MGLAPYNAQKHLGFCMGTPCGHVELLNVAHTAFLFHYGCCENVHTHIDLNISEPNVTKRKK